MSGTDAPHADACHCGRHKQEITHFVPLEICFGMSHHRQTVFAKSSGETTHCCRGGERLRCLCVFLRGVSLRRKPAWMAAALAVMFPAHPRPARPRPAGPVCLAVLTALDSGPGTPSCKRREAE